MFQYAKKNGIDSTNRKKLYRIWKELKNLLGSTKKYHQNKYRNTTQQPEDALKERISSPSIEDPASQPTTDLCPKRKKFGDNSSDSSDAPIIISFPLTARLPNTSS